MPSPTKTAGVLGWLVVGIALAWNKWAVERLVATDEHIESLKSLAVIVGGQLVCLAVGWVLLRRGWPRSWPDVLRRLATAIGLVILAIGVMGSLRALGIVDPHRERRAVIVEVTAAEELVIVLTPQLDRLRESLRNLRFPDERSIGLFTDPVLVRDVGPLPAMSDASAGAGILIQDASEVIAGDPAWVSLDSLVLFGSLLDSVHYVDHIDFGVVEGRFSDPTHVAFEMRLELALSARMVDGSWRGYTVGQTMVWSREESAAPVAEAESWRIASWRMDSIDLKRSPRRLFAEVLDGAVPDPLLRQELRRSRNEELAGDFLRDSDAVRAAYPFYNPIAIDTHPGVSVVDFDRDGWDDLYVTGRWGTNIMLHNQGDGTFEDVATDLGLDIEDHTASVVFADFDNDGDIDAFLGRTMAPSLYMVNEKGRFVDRTEALVEGPAPCLVTSASAADVDGDGLLDLYLSTYAASLHFAFMADLTEGRFDTCLPLEDREGWMQEVASDEQHFVLNHHGPPNRYLHNIGGGRFEVVRDSVLAQYRHTLQATWADYDNDGDPDLYLANDFAPNNLLRNDGAAGFVDVTDETGTADLGFGMGASWGDFDDDGLLDLYVTNMYSKAGRRITAQLTDLDPRLGAMSRGNTLFHNRGSHFEKISGDEPGQLTVEAAGWSWSGQWVDFDNDTDLDLVALSGYYTAPDSWALPVDL